MPRVKLFSEEEVLTKAIQLFWKQGYEATSVQELVKRLGINRASLYDTFGDKEQLFKRALSEYKKQNLNALQNHFSTYENAYLGFKTLFERAIKEGVLDSDRKGCFVVNTITELIPNDGAILDFLESNRIDFEQLFSNYLTQSQEKGLINEKVNPTATASLFYTFYCGLRVVSKVNKNENELLNSLDVLLDLLKN